MAVKVKDVAAVIEAFAPLSLQEEYDNSGLNVGDYEAEVQGVLLCVDVTERVLDEAESLDVNLIVSHHPLLFHPLRQIVEANFTQRIVRRALLSGISLYAAHTNLDSAAGGMSFRLGSQLGLVDMQELEPHTPGAATGFGVVGNLPEPTEMKRFLQKVRAELHCGAIRHSALCRETVRRVALVTGAGASMVESAILAGADLYLTADMKYNDFYMIDGNFYYGAIVNNVPEKTGLYKYNTNGKDQLEIKDKKGYAAYSAQKGVYINKETDKDDDLTLMLYANNKKKQLPEKFDAQNDMTVIDGYLLYLEDEREDKVYSMIKLP